MPTERLMWHFQRRRGADVWRDTKVEEFFASDDVGHSVAGGLVREGIQNALDARNPDLPPDKPVRVRMFITGGEAGHDPRDLEPFFDELWPHLKAQREWVHGMPREREKCRFLVFEDFNTTGLAGDPYAVNQQGKANGFWHFFRAEGVSDKGEGKLGSWGLGKTAFPRASRINSWFGLTQRVSDPQPLLMGRAVLTNHEVDGKYYDVDGTFGVRAPGDDDAIVKPVKDRELISRFADTFRLQRGEDEDPGLSVVVPYYLVDDVTGTLLADAIREHFFAPILSGRLEVWLDEGGTSQKFTAASLKKWAEDESAGHDIVRRRIRLYLATRREETRRIDLPIDAMDNAPSWDKVEVSKEVVDSLRESIDSGEPVVVSAPLRIRKQAESGQRPPAEESRFEVALEVSESDRYEPPAFLREGLYISSVDAPKLQGFTSVVTIDDTHAAEMLRNAENVSHTRWEKEAKQQDGLKFKDRYVYAPALLKFIKHAPRAILKLRDQENEEPDKAFLADIFGLPSDEPVPPKARSRSKRKPERVVPPDIDLPKRLKRLRIEKTPGGFRVHSGDPGAERPPRIRVTVAYDTLEGDPFKEYDKPDFSFAARNSRLIIKGRGCELREAKDNELLLEPKDDDFEYSVTGFDVRRDLKVRADVEEAPHADS